MSSVAERAALASGRAPQGLRRAPGEKPRPTRSNASSRVPPLSRQSGAWRSRPKRFLAGTGFTRRPGEALTLPDLLPMPVRNFDPSRTLKCHKKLFWPRLLRGYTSRAEAYELPLRLRGQHRLSDSNPPLQTRHAQPRKRLAKKGPDEAPDTTSTANFDRDDRGREPQRRGHGQRPWDSLN